MTKAVVLIRFIVGHVFITEGIQKFIFSEQLGAGRFAKIGIPFPEFFGPFVGATEIICGSLILVGFLTRLAAVPSLIIMTVALATTKLHLINLKGYLTFSHEARNDLLMFFSCLFLLWVGSGALSLDRWWSKEK
jgi:putative oxidoreductase